ncbi:MAG TPA: M23 family metallopeptidase [candidate division Zixibacteria bacterium]|nr:M23 family metallopeptidase [candidate division Zixibacteria bacterium]
MGKYSFQIIPPHSGKVRQLRVEGSRLKWVLFGLGALVLINAFILGFNLFYVGKVAENRTAGETNEQLSASLDAMSRRADSLATIICDLREMSTLVRDKADLPPIDPAQYAYGIGGPELDFLDPNKPIILARARDIDRKLDSLILSAKTERKALEEAREHFEKKRHVLAHTPSIWPLRGYVSSGFGRRLDPFTGIWKMHEGIDICARRGTPVRASADGTIRFAGWYHGYGKMVRINHTYYETRYGHLDDIKVRPGQKVKRGDIIGTVGNTGNATGVHLHYEVRVSGRPVDPRQYISPEVVVD